jgi:hypothetical protein
MESMRKNPEKNNSLIYYNNSNSSSWYGSQFYTNNYTNTEHHQYQLNSYDSFFEAIKSTLLGDADILYEQLLKVLVYSNIADYALNRDSSLLPTSLPINQTYGYKEESRIIRTKNR